MFSRPYFGIDMTEHCYILCVFGAAEHTDPFLMINKIYI